MTVCAKIDLGNKCFKFQEDHEDVNIQPVENPNFHVVPETEIFFNKKPKEALVFRRGGEEKAPPVIADLLPQEELMKKINDRKAKKDKANEDNGEYIGLKEYF
jgi:hypothetical protein